MKLLIPLLSSLLLMIQMPIQAEEASNHSSQPITVSNVIIDIDTFINNHKIALQAGYTYKIMLSANALLDIYKKTNDQLLKVKITEALLLKDGDDWTFLHYASDDDSAIIQTTIDALKESPDIIQKLLMTKGELEGTFLHVAADNGNNEIIKTTIESLKDRPEMLHKLLMAKDKDGNSGNTFLNWAAIEGKSDIIQTTIEALKDLPDMQDDLLIELLKLKNNEGESVIDMVPRLSKINTTIKK